LGVAGGGGGDGAWNNSFASKFDLTYSVAIPLTDVGRPFSP